MREFFFLLIFVRLTRNAANERQIEREREEIIFVLLHLWLLCVDVSFLPARLMCTPFNPIVELNL